MDSAPPKAKKQRCISKQRREYLRGKHERRGYGAAWQHERAAAVNSAVVRAEESATEAKARAKQQLDAGRNQLNDERAQLQQTSRNKFREADAAKTQAKHTTAWANNLINKELSGNKLSKALSSAAKMIQTGHVDMPAARRAAALKVAQDKVHPSRLSVLEKGTSVWYFHTDGQVSAATILSVHYDAGWPYYRIKIDDESGERDTVREKLVLL